MAELTISERESGDNTILDLTGDIIFGQSNTVLRHGIRNRLKDGKRNIVLNLTDVGYLDSSGIGELISALTAINREQGSLTLMNPGERIVRLLEISKLTEIFDIDSGN